MVASLQTENGAKKQEKALHFRFYQYRIHNNPCPVDQDELATGSTNTEVVQGPGQLSLTGPDNSTTALA